MKAFLDSFNYNAPLSLYIHVPFCISKCSYCAFYSVPCASEEMLDRYTEKVVSEIEVVNKKNAGKCYVTAFIGGGNPGILGPERLGRIAKAICENGRPYEFSVEMNPESLSEDFFPLFSCYFTRLSMGIQSLDQKALSFLGRNADYDSTRRGLELSQRLRVFSGCSISYDLITCLGSWHNELSDIRALVSEYDPDHLSVYALTLEEGTPLYKKNPVLPDSDEQYEILKRIWEYLESCIYEHYEVSNFAKKGKRCVHNCRYWAYGQYLGLGPGSASTAFSSDDSVTRFSFSPNVKAYVSSSLFENYESEALTSFEACEELVFMGLRYKGGLDLERFKAMYGKDLKLNQDSLLEGYGIIDGHLVPSSEGLMVCDAQASLIIDAMHESP